MFRKTLLLACFALMATLLSTSDVRAWYAYRYGGYGGYRGGYGGYRYGGYHYGGYGGYRSGYVRRW